MASYYVDSCIYLNLWKSEEEGLFKKQLWKIAKRFFDRVEKNNEIIYYSGYLLKEISYLLSKKEMKEKVEMFESSPNFKRVVLSEKEFELARKIERKSNFKISFFDILHMILSKKTNSILITRDKKLLKLCDKYNISSRRPEEIIH